MLDKQDLEALSKLINDTIGVRMDRRFDALEKRLEAAGRALLGVPAQAAEERTAARTVKPPR